MTIRTGHPGGGFVQNQYAWLQRQCQRQFNQALLPVCKIAHRRFFKFQQVELRKYLADFRLDCAKALGTAKPVLAFALALQNGQADVFAHGHGFEQGGDLKGFCHPGLYPFAFLKPRNINPVQPHRAAIGVQYSGDQVGKCRFSGAIGADQSLAVARLQVKVDILRNLEATKAFV